MRRHSLLGYTGLMAIVTGLAIFFAVHSYQRAEALSSWKTQRTHWQQVAAEAKKRDDLASAKNTAARAAAAKLAKQVNDTNAAIAAEIEKTKKLKRKIITGSTIVSYVTAPTKAG